MKVLILSFFLLLSMGASADILFEGYYKISLSQKPVGFHVKRVEKNKKNNFKIISYKEIKFPGHEKTYETLISVSDPFLRAKSYEYKVSSKNYTHRSWGKFYKKGKKWHFKGFVKRKNKKAKKISLSQKNPYILHSTLTHLLAQIKNKKERMSYKAFLEETGALVSGEFSLKKKDVWRRCERKACEEITVSPFEEVLKTKHTNLPLKTELLDSFRSLSFKVSKKNLKKIFHSFPKGRLHSLNKNQKRRTSL